MTLQTRSKDANRIAFNPCRIGQLRAFSIAPAVAAQMIAGKKAIEEKEYDVHSYTKRVHETGRFRIAAARHFSELSQPGTVPSCTASGTDRTGRRLEPLTMFRINVQTGRAFTLAEILIMAAINNMETRRPQSVNTNCEQEASSVAKRSRLSEPAIQGECL